MVNRWSGRKTECISIDLRLHSLKSSTLDMFILLCFLQLQLILSYHKFIRWSMLGLIGLFSDYENSSVFFYLTWGSFLLVFDYPVRFRFYNNSLNLLCRSQNFWCTDDLILRLMNLFLWRNSPNVFSQSKALPTSVKAEMLQWELPFRCCHVNVRVFERRHFIKYSILRMLINIPRWLDRYLGGKWMCNFFLT